MRLFETFVVLIVLVIVSLSIANSFLKNINERTREIGTLRSLGYTGRTISAIFFWEAVFLSSIGCFVGAVVSLLITVGVNHSGITYRAGQFVEATAMTIGIQPENYLRVLIYITLLSVIVCHLVLRRTLKIQVAENLAHA